MNPESCKSYQPKRKVDRYIEGARSSKLETQNCGTVLIRFRVHRLLRFLSHAETVRVFQRACVRAGIKIRYTQGFNPRPKLSLPLPRSVGVESDDDLLCLRMDSSELPFDSEAFKARLSAQLPEGCELLSVEVAKVGTPPQPRLSTYVLPVQREYLDAKLRATVKRLLASETLNLRRWIDVKKSKFKDVDVRPFLKSIEFDDGRIIVECKISSAGSIRVDEILRLLELDMEKLAAPIRRTNVQWQVSE